MLLNPQKCEAKILTFRRCTDPEKNKIGNIEVAWNGEDSAVKYLGIHLDKRLTWKHHVAQKLQEANI